MAFKFINSVQQIATGTGTGGLTLGAVTSVMFRTLQAAGMANGDTARVRIQHSTILNEWEVVLITYNSGAITRTFDAESFSSTGGLIPFSAGDKYVSSVAISSDFVPSSAEIIGALGYTPANKAGDTFTGRVAVNPSSSTENFPLVGYGINSNGIVFVRVQHLTYGTYADWGIGSVSGFTQFAAYPVSGTVAFNFSITGGSLLDLFIDRTSRFYNLVEAPFFQTKTNDASSPQYQWYRLNNADGERLWISYLANEGTLVTYLQGNGGSGSNAEYFLRKMAGGVLNSALYDNSLVTAKWVKDLFATGNTGSSYIDVSINGVQSIPSITQTKINFATEYRDLGGCWDAANSRFVCTIGKEGYWKFDVRVSIDIRDTLEATVVIQPRKNNVLQAGQSHYFKGRTTFQTSTASISFTTEAIAGDVIDVTLWHDAGENINTRYDAAYTRLNAVRIAPREGFLMSVDWNGKTQHEIDSIHAEEVIILKEQAAADVVSIDFEHPPQILPPTPIEMLSPEEQEKFKPTIVDKLVG